MNMLSRYLLFLLVFFGVACSSGKTVTLVADNPDEAIARLVAVLEEAVATQDKQLLMGLMDPDYVVEQHDGFLDGRTEQFLNEFFGGLDIETGDYINVRVDELKKIYGIQVEAIEGENFYDMEGIVVLTSGDEIRSTWFLVVHRLSSRQYRAGLRGAVG